MRHVRQIKEKLECLYKVAVSHLATQDEQNVVLESDPKLALKMGIGIKCVDSEWPVIQGLRRFINMRLEEEGRVSDQ